MRARARNKQTNNAPAAQPPRCPGLYRCAEGWAAAGPPTAEEVRRAKAPKSPIAQHNKTHTHTQTHTHTHTQPHPKERQAHARHLIHTGHQVPKAESHHEQQQKTTGEKYGVQIDWRGQEAVDEKAPSSFFVSSQSPGRLLLIPCAERTRPLFVIYHTKKNGAACCSAVRARVYYYWCYF
jgi:hypothetical protein